jgi:hypothetical protein
VTLHDDPERDTDDHGDDPRADGTPERHGRPVEAGGDPPDHEADRERPQHPDEARGPGIFVVAPPADRDEHHEHRGVGERSHPDRYVAFAHWAIVADVLGRRPIGASG